MTEQRTQDKKKQTSDCLFCKTNDRTDLILESDSAFAIYDKFPVSKGHVLIIPKRHCADYFELDFNEQSACWALLNEVKEIIQNKFHPDGFNVGININESAGQTIWHAHIHLIPRYHGDDPKPRGGVRGVIPGKKEY